MTAASAASSPLSNTLGPASIPSVSKPASAPPGRVNTIPDLPVECGRLNGGEGATVIICRPPQESLTDKFLAVAPSLGISLLALFLSGYALFYNARKDSTARKLSIKDDYWLRKIVSPTSIEPFVALTSVILAELPEAGNAELTADSLKAWYDTSHKALIRLKPGFRTLQLLDETLLSDVENELSVFEDELATYVGFLDAYLTNAGQPVPVRATSVAVLSQSRLRLLQSIQLHQTILGAKEPGIWAQIFRRKAS